MRSQVDNYAFQGNDLEDISILDFVQNTYEVLMSKKDLQRRHTTEGKGFTHTTEGQGSMQGAAHRGRPRNQCSFYLAQHPKHSTHCQIIRSAGHNTLPDIVGPFFPNEKAGDPEHYYASVLALLRPWHDIKEIKHGYNTFQMAYDYFLESATESNRNVISGI